MIQFGSTGYLIEQNSWSDSIADIQMGSWLVRPVYAATPEPGQIMLFSTVIAMLGVGRRFRKMPRG